MTKIPVNTIGSLNPLQMGQVKKSSAQGKLTDGFENVMSQASAQEGKETDKAVTSKTAVQPEKKTQTDMEQGRKNPVSEKVTDKKLPEKEKTESLSKVSKPDEEVGEENTIDAAILAIADVMSTKVAETLELSPEEMKETMNELGMTAVDLLNPPDLTGLIVKASGEESPLALLTNEPLYNTVQDLMQTQSLLTEELAQNLDLTDEELKQLLTQTTVSENVQEPLTEEKTAAFAEMPAFTEPKMQQTQTSPEIEQSNVPDENAEQLLTADRAELSPEHSGEEASDSGKHFLDQKKQPEAENGTATAKTGTEAAQPVFQNATEATPEVQNLSETAEPRTTQEIMDQILEYIRVQAKPEMEQLEMQLHPASLGNVKIQLTARGGEVTAQFQVQNENVKNALESQLTILKENLKEQGVKVEAVEVTVESHAFESNLWQGQERNSENPYQEKKRQVRRLNLNELSEEYQGELQEEEALAAEMLKANGGTVDYTA